MPTDPKLTNVPASPREKLFRTVDAILRADETVPAIFPLILSWRGEPRDKEPLAIDQGNALRLTPRPVEQHFWTPSEHKGTLLIDCELLVSGVCWDDVDRCWYAIERAFFPFDPVARDRIVQRFSQNFAWKPVMEFNAQPYDPNGPADGVWRAGGQMRITYRMPGFWS